MHKSIKTLTLDLAERSYPIFIGTELLGREDLFKPYIKGQQVMLVSNETVAPLYLHAVLPALVGFQVDQVILPDGEQYKNITELNRIFDALLSHKHNRTTTVIALGGGVIGDMAGFAAACYQRGVNFIQVPTTLLAQVDSSVGGKTAVNHALGKNMIGAFHQPQAVVADTNTLNSLPPRELAAGIAEVIKYGLIFDAEFFVWLEANIEALNQRDPNALAYAIQVSCEAKAKIVAADEKEAGQRALLNLGHTFGHAIEAAQGYGQWLHGEAVAVGMLMAADLSLRLGWINEQDLVRIDKLIRAAHLPHQPPADMSVEQFLTLMAVDKKVIDGDLRLVLLKSIGRAQVTKDFPQSTLIETLSQSSLKPKPLI